MKFQVKTTALAILVSLGVVGCTGGGSSSNDSKPEPTTPINQPEQPQPEQPQPQPEQPQPQPEQPQPQPEQPQPQPEQPQPQPEQPQPQPEQPQPQPEQPQPEQPQPQPEQPQPQPEQPQPQPEQPQPQPEQPQPQPEQPQPEQPQPQPEQPQPQPEQPQPQPEQPQPQPEQPQPQPEQPQPQPEQPQPQPEQPQPQPEQPQPQPEPQPDPASKAVNLLDKNGVEWRIINIRSNGPSNNTTEYRDSIFLYDPVVSSRESFFKLDGVNAETELNFNELSAQDGKPFLGIHQGKKEDPDFSGKIVTKVIRDGSWRLRAVELEDAKAFNYLYVNQPYSTYGALFTNGHDVKFFSVAQKAEENSSAGYNSTYPVWKEEVVERNGQSVKTGKIIWNDAVAGEATYKGQVIASVVKADMEGMNNGIRWYPF